MVLVVIIAQAICAIAHTVVVKDFYGTKARNSKKNPCKGECIHKCGDIRTQYVTIAPGVVAVTEIMVDIDGNVVYHESYMQQSSEDEAVSNLIENYVEENVVITVEDDD